MTFITSSIGRSASTSASSPAPSSAASPAATRSELGQRGVRCLWVTMADPEPRHNGQYVYSGGLIDSLAAAGGHVEVLGLSRSEAPHANPNAHGARSKQVVWCLPEDSPHSRWGSLASTLPNIAYRCRTSGMRRML